MFDTKTQSFSYPLYYEGFEAADKWFDTIVNAHGCGVTHTHSHDFVVYHIGTYDVESGTTTYFEDRKFYLSLGGLRRPCKACERHAEQAKKLAQQHLETNK